MKANKTKHKQKMQFKAIKRALIRRKLLTTRFGACRINPKDYKDV